MHHDTSLPPLWHVARGGALALLDELECCAHLTVRVGRVAKIMRRLRWALATEVRRVGAVTMIPTSSPQRVAHLRVVASFT